MFETKTTIDFCQQELGGSKPGDKRVKVMAFPPLGIETLAPVVRQHGHRVRMFDTCHPQMQPRHIAQAVEEEHPEFIALSFLSTTTYPPAKNLAKRLKIVAPNTPIILGGVFASMNAMHILKDCRYVDCVGVGEGEELLPDFINNINNLGNVAGLVWSKGDEIIQNEARHLSVTWINFPTRTGRVCQSIILNRFLWIFPRCYRSINSVRCRRQEAVHMAVFFAIYLLYLMANGGTAQRNTFWEKCNSSMTPATARSTSRMTISCSNARTLLKSATA